MSDSTPMDSFKATITQIDDAQLRQAREPVRILVTPFAVAGSITEGPMVDERGPTGQRQVLVHPDDWAKILPPPHTETPLHMTAGMVWGIPVVIEES